MFRGNPTRTFFGTGPVPTNDTGSPVAVSGLGDGGALSGRE